MPNEINFAILKYPKPMKIRIDVKGHNWAVNTDNLNGRNNKRMWQPFFIGSTLAEKLAKGSYTVQYNQECRPKGFLGPCDTTNKFVSGGT